SSVFPAHGAVRPGLGGRGEKISVAPYVPNLHSRFDLHLFRLRTGYAPAGARCPERRALAREPRGARLCRAARLYGDRWCFVPASPVVQHPPKNRPAVELTRRELCSGHCRRTRCHWPRVDFTVRRAGYAVSDNQKECLATPFRCARKELEAELERLRAKLARLQALVTDAMPFMYDAGDDEDPDANAMARAWLD